MDLYVLDDTRTPIGIIDDYESLIWSKRYAKFGDCELYTRASSNMIELMNSGYYLQRNDDDMICRVESVELETSADEGDHLIITGKDCRSILGQRVVWNQTNYTGTVEGYIRKLITDNVISPSLSDRAINGFMLGASAGLADTISEQVTYDSLDEKIIELCEAYGYGSKLTMDDDYNFVFTLYRGEDRSYSQDANDFVVFSPDFDNIVSSNYKQDASNYKNVALIAGEGEGTDRKRITYGSATGIDRYELFVDAKDVSSTVEEGETVDYDAALQARGVSALSEHNITESFDGEVESDSYIYHTDYELGDIVQVVNNYGMEASARIVEVIESFDSNGYTCIPTFQYDS